MNPFKGNLRWKLERWEQWTGAIYSERAFHRHSVRGLYICARPLVMSAHNLSKSGGPVAHQLHLGHHRNGTWIGARMRARSSARIGVCIARTQ